MSNNSENLNTSSINSDLNRNLTGPEFFKNSWLFAQIFNTFFIIGTIWNLIAFITYATRNDKWKRGDKKKRKNSNLLLLATLCPCTLLVRLLSTEALILVGKTGGLDPDGDRMCEIVFDFNIVMFSFSTLPVYTFFWYRQKMLYSEASLKMLNTKTVKFFSNAFVVLIFLGGGSACFVKTIPIAEQNSNFGCVERTGRKANHLPSFITAFTLIISQVILFGLFIHPLRLHGRGAKASLKRSASVTKKKKKKEERVFQAIKSAFVSCVICVFSDVVALVMSTLVLPKTTPLCLTRNLYDMSLFVNLISVMFCFKNSSEILFVLCGKCKKERTRVDKAATFNALTSFGRRQRLLCKNNLRFLPKLELRLRGKDEKKSEPLAQLYNNLHSHNIAGHFFRPLRSPSQTAQQRSKGLAEKIRLGHEEEEKEGGESLSGDQVSFCQLCDLRPQRRRCSCHVNSSFA